MNNTKNEITSVCLTTCDRPESLLLSLESLISNLIKYNRKPRIIIVDDSEILENINKGKDIAKSQSARSGINIEYIDRTDRFELSKTISASKGIPLEITNFAICGDKRSITTVGSVRNTFFIKTNGEKILLVEDDIYYNFKSIAKDDGPIFTNQNPFDYVFLNETNNIPPFFKDTDIDILRLHEKNLGSTVGEILGPETPLYINDSRIIDSYIGCIGDSPMESHISLLLLPQVYNNLQKTSAEEYELNKSTDRIIQYPSITSVYDGIMSISLVMGLDNRGLIPVATPIGRGHDLIFGCIRNKAFPTKLSAYEPVTINHNRPKLGNRKVSYDIVKEITKMDRVLASFINGMESEVDEAKNLTRIGETLISLSNEPQNLFNLIIEEQCNKICRDTSQYINHILMTTDNMPDFWINDLKSYRDVLMTPNPEYFVFNMTRDVGNEFNFRLNILREWFGLFGQLLKNWNNILIK